MVAIAPCPACKVGNHAEHDPDWGSLNQPRDTPPEKIIVGGYHCACSGGCPPENGKWDGEFWWGPASPPPPVHNEDEQRWDDNGGA